MIFEFAILGSQEFWITKQAWASQTMSPPGGTVRPNCFSVITTAKRWTSGQLAASWAKFLTVTPCSPASQKLISSFAFRKFLASWPLPSKKNSTRTLASSDSSSLTSQSLRVLIDATLERCPKKLSNYSKGPCSWTQQRDCQQLSASHCPTLTSWESPKSNASSKRTCSSRHNRLPSKSPRWTLTWTHLWLTKREGESHPSRVRRCAQTLMEPVKTRWRLTTQAALETTWTRWRCRAQAAASSIATTSSISKTVTREHQVKWSPTRSKWSNSSPTRHTSLSTVSNTLEIFNSQVLTTKVSKLSL